MDYACYFDDIIMESEGEKGLGSLALIEAESLRPTVADFHRAGKAATSQPLIFEVTQLPLIYLSFVFSSLIIECQQC